MPRSLSGLATTSTRNLTYTVETYLVNMSFDEKTNTSSLLAMDRLDRFTVPLPHNQTSTLPYTFIPERTGTTASSFFSSMRVFLMKVYGGWTG